MRIRETADTDFDDIMNVERQAFGEEDEAILTADLLGDASAVPKVSLLAFHDEEAVGHILFTKAVIEGRPEAPLLHILAPLAVKPGYQKQGIGGLLIREGLKRLREIGSEMVFVLGHKKYYPKYGFLPDAGGLGFPAPFPIPAKDADAWMVQPLTSGGLPNCTGRILCAETMNKPDYWRE